MTLIARHTYIAALPSHPTPRHSHVKEVLWSGQDIYRYVCRDQHMSSVSTVCASETCRGDWRSNDSPYFNFQ